MTTIQGDPNLCTASVERMCTSVDVLCAFVKDYTTTVGYRTANVEKIVFLVEEQIPIVVFSPHHSPDGIMVGFAEW